jgi:hypothetical protein
MTKPQTISTRAHFRLIQAPCCGTTLCWVNPRLPNYCPECGTFIYSALRTQCPENIVVSREDAWITYDEGDPR